MDPLFIWQMQCEFIMVNTFYLKQALDEMQKEGLTLALKLEPDSVPFLCCTRMKNHSFFIFHFFAWFVCSFLGNRAFSARGMENVTGSGLVWSVLRLRIGARLFFIQVREKGQICTGGFRVRRGKIHGEIIWTKNKKEQFCLSLWRTCGGPYDQEHPLVQGVLFCRFGKEERFISKDVQEYFIHCN